MKVETQSIKDVEGQVVVGDEMVDEGNLVSQAFHRMKIIRNWLISKLIQGKIFLEVYCSGPRPASIHGG